MKMAGVVAEDLPAFVATGSNVIPATGSFDAQRACHELVEPAVDRLVNPNLPK